MLFMCGDDNLAFFADYRVVISCVKRNARDCKSSYEVRQGLVPSGWSSADRAGPLAWSCTCYILLALHMTVECLGTSHFFHPSS